MSEETQSRTIAPKIEKHTHKSNKSDIDFHTVEFALQELAWNWQIAGGLARSAGKALARQMDHGA